MRFLILLLVVAAACGGGGGDSEQSCTASTQCSMAAPYCSAETCAATCGADTECPGFGESADEKFCVGGSCVTCRMDMNDCSGTSPVCDDGACRRCNLNSECASGACASDGSCVAETSIAYVSPTGSATSSCTKADPCGIVRGLALSPPLQFIVLANGTYSQIATLTISGRRNLIGTGTTRPILTRSVAGPIVSLALGADVTFEHIEFSGATNGGGGGNTTGSGILCPDGSANNMGVTVRVKDGAFINNQGAGIEARKCAVEVFNSTFNTNSQGLGVVDTNAKVERSSFTGNKTALFLDAGLFLVTNNFITRNEEGIDLFANAGTIVEFNTIADNTVFGLRCQSFAGATPFPNNLLARNMVNTPASTTCSYPNSITATTDIGPIKFKSPDAAPFDYHITAGSSAIDLGAATSLTTDFDGETRPIGAAPDIGADELQ